MIIKFFRLLFRQLIETNESLRRANNSYSNEIGASVVNVEPNVLFIIIILCLKVLLYYGIDWYNTFSLVVLVELRLLRDNQNVSSWNNQT